MPLRADAGASLLRVAAAVLRERGAAAPAARDHGYDLALEQALLDAGEEFDVVSYLASGRDRGKFCHLGPDGDARVIDVPNTYATELVARAADGRPEAARRRRPGAGAGVGELRRDRGRLHRLPAEARSRGRRPCRPSRRSCGAATSSSSATACATGTSASFSTASGAAQPLSYRSWAVAARDAPRSSGQFWRRRDVDVLDLALEELRRRRSARRSARMSRQRA